MNHNRLIELLNAYDVPSSFYSFDGPGSDTWVLEAHGDKWQLYYSERGNRFDERTYASEEQACLAMFTEINKMLASEHLKVMALS